MILPFLALFFLLIDTCYAIFVKATLQYAVQQGVYDAITFPPTSGPTYSPHMLVDVQDTVAAQSLNLVGGSGSAGTVTIGFYAPPSGSGTALTYLGNGPGTNQVGNIVEVDAAYPFAPLAPLFRSGAVINFYASSAAVLAVYPPPTL